MANTNLRECTAKWAGPTQVVSKLLWGKMYWVDKKTNKQKTRGSIIVCSHTEWKIAKSKQPEESQEHDANAGLSLLFKCPVDKHDRHLIEVRLWHWAAG